MWYSHKFKGAGLRYEIGVCITSGEIVWAYGGVPCGAWPDVKLARSCIVDALDEGEKIIADGGYNDGETHFITPSGVNNYCSRLQKLVRARHETLNARLKTYHVLSDRFRHPRSKHAMCFYAVVNIVHVAIISGDSPLFAIEYDE